MNDDDGGGSDDYHHHVGNTAYDSGIQSMQFMIADDGGGSNDDCQHHQYHHHHHHVGIATYGSGIQSILHTAYDAGKTSKQSYNEQFAIPERAACLSIHFKGPFVFVVAFLC